MSNDFCESEAFFESVAIATVKENNETIAKISISNAFDKSLLNNFCADSSFEVSKGAFFLWVFLSREGFLLLLFWDF